MFFRKQRKKLKLTDLSLALAQVWSNGISVQFPELTHAREFGRPPAKTTSLAFQLLVTHERWQSTPHPHTTQEQAETGRNLATASLPREQIKESYDLQTINHRRHLTSTPHPRFAPNFTVISKPLKWIPANLYMVKKKVNPFKENNSQDKKKWRLQLSECRGNTWMAAFKIQVHWSICKYHCSLYCTR